MKVKMILATMLTVLAMGCRPSSNKSTNSAANNEARIDSTEFLKPTNINITEKKWQEILDRIKVIRKQEEEESFETYVYEEIDHELGVYILNKLFEERGWQPVADSQYVERIKYIFGINLDGHKYPKDNKLQKQKGYTVYFINNPELQYEYAINKNDVYFYRNLGIICSDMPVPQSFVQSNELGDYFINREYFDLFDYHWNNYLLKNSIASLVTLINGEEYFYPVYNLLYIFGFDKEEILNKKILRENNNDYSNYNHLFAAHDIYGELDIRDGLLSTVANMTSKDTTRYYSMLENYIRYCVETPLVSDNEIQNILFKEFNINERRQIIAYCIPTLQSLYNKYYSNDKNTVSPIILEAIHTDPEMISEWKKNNYYGIEELSKYVALTNNTVTTTIPLPMSLDKYLKYSSEYLDFQPADYLISFLKRIEFDGSEYQCHNLPSRNKNILPMLLWICRGDNEYYLVVTVDVSQGKVIDYLSVGESTEKGVISFFIDEDFKITLYQAQIVHNESNNAYDVVDKEKINSYQIGVDGKIRK